MVVQVMKTSHAMMVVQVIKTVQVMKVREAMKVEKVKKIKYEVLGYRRVIYEELELPTDPKSQAELQDFFRDENPQVLHRLQSSLMNTSLSGHTEAASYPPPLHQVPISSLGSFAVSRPTKILTRLVG